MKKYAFNIISISIACILALILIITIKEKNMYIDILVENTQLKDYINHLGTSILFTGGLTPFSSLIMNNSLEGMPRAAIFFENFWENKGKSIYLKSSDVYSIITSSKRNTEHFNHNMNAIRSLCEDTVKTGQVLTFATKPNSGFKAACYSNVGNNCCLVNKHSMPDQNNIEIDWHYAIGDALCGIVIEVKNEGDYYYAKYKYKIMDIYEWGWHYSRDNYELHMLHELGLAHEFLFEGTYEGVEFWRKGERYEERAN